MKSEWRVERSSGKPEQFQQLADDVWIQRRNIRKAANLEDGSDGGYECESRRISADVHDALIEEMQSPTMTSMMQALSGIEAEQAMQGVTSDGNMETIMQAISDLQADVAMIGM